MYKKELLYKHKDLHLTPPPSEPILKSQAEWPAPVSQCWGGKGEAAWLCCEEEKEYGIELSRQHRKGSKLIEHWLRTLEPKALTLFLMIFPSTKLRKQRGNGDLTIEDYSQK